MDKREIESLIKLIDDDDEQIYQHVKSRLLMLGHDAIDELQEYSLRSENEIQHNRLKEIVGLLNVERVKGYFTEWLKNGSFDLLEGFFIVAKYRYPDLDKQTIVHYLDKIKLDIWLRLNFKFSPVDNIRVINEVFFGKYRFHGDDKNYFSPENSYINQVIETRKGNPVSLSILYSIIAQKLYLPVLGVNLPQHYILAYKDDTFLQDDDRFNSSGIIPFNLKGDVLFYVNPFNSGAVFSKYNIDRFLEQSNMPPNQEYYEPCTNIQTITRVLRNLSIAYEKKGDEQRMTEITALYEWLKKQIITDTGN